MSLDPGNRPRAVIVIVAGVSGSGKSTIGALLAGWLSWPFIDGDVLHPEANIKKLERGEPLNDEDRLPWLRSIAAVMDERIAAGGSSLIACSALKKSYREMLLAGRPTARLAFLQIGRDVAGRRLATRHGHFFDPVLLDSQFADLELPAAGEAGVVVVPVRDSAEETAAEIIRDLHIDRQAGVV